MLNKNNEISNIDVLAEIEDKNNNENDILHFIEDLNPVVDLNLLDEEKTNYYSYNKIKEFFIFIFKYITTSSLIFIILMWIMNFWAYKSIALSYLDKETMEENSIRLAQAINQSNIDKKETPKIKTKKNINKKKNKIDTEKIKKEIKDHKNNISEIEENKTYHSMSKLLYKTNSEKINFDINITPYENRVVIPKIGKNIPLLDINKKTVKDAKELEWIFMDELKDWIIRYPWSAKPGEKWNSFIFWHSSNLPWIKWDYNDVFALLDKVVYNDEVIVYYWQKQYKYKIREKKVISPGEVSVLKRSNDKSEITLMTCWPVWTTLNRLIVVWELIE